MTFTVIDATSRNGVRNVISNQRFITGYVSMAGIGLVPYEGPMERDFLEAADFARKLSYVGAQPLRLKFKEGKHNRYTPDFLCRFKPDKHNRIFSPVLYEIKPRADLRKKWGELRPGFQRAALLCRQRGWRFRIATERIIRAPRLKQFKFLRGFIDYVDHDCIGETLVRVMNELKISTPAKLLAASFSDPDRRLEAVGILWKLVIDGKIRIDIHKPLTMASPIWSLLNV